MHNVLFIQTIQVRKQTYIIHLINKFISILVTECVDQHIRRGLLWGYAYCAIFLEAILKTILMRMLEMNLNMIVCTGKEEMELFIYILSHCKMDIVAYFISLLGFKLCLCVCVCVW